VQLIVVAVDCNQEDVGGTTYFYVHDESTTETNAVPPTPQVHCIQHTLSVFQLLLLHLYHMFF